MAIVASLTICGIWVAETWLWMSGDQMYPSDVPLAANTCEGDPGVTGFSVVRSGADWATLTTQPATASSPDDDRRQDQHGGQCEAPGRAGIHGCAGGAAVVRVGS